MKKIKDKIIVSIKKPKIFIPIIVVCLIFISLFFVNSNKSVNQEIFTVKNGDVVQTVSVSGKTKAVSSADLSFEKSGKVKSISVKVGDRVVIGQELIKLDTTDLNANLLQAQAGLSAENAKLSEMIKGTRLEELNLQYSKTQKAESDLFSSKSSLINQIKNSYTTSDDSIRSKLYPIFVDPNKYNASLKFGAELSITNDIKSEKNDVEDALNLWYKSLKDLNDSSDLSVYYNKAKDNLNLIKKLLDNCSIALSSVLADSSISQSDIDVWKLNISTARTNINLAINSLTSSVNDYEALLYAYKISKDELVIKQAGYTSEQLQAEEALVESARAQVSSIQAQIYKNIIYSPIDGIITKQDTKIGEVVSPNENIISVLSDSNFEVEAYVPEINVGKISVENDVKMKMDAFAGEEFLGKVSYIEPAETLIDNIPNFKLKIVFNNVDNRLKNGLTVDASIEVNKKMNVMTLPRYSILEDSDKKYVQKLQGSKKIKTFVDIGIQGDNGLTEILSGLKVGDQVVFSGNNQ